MSPRVPADKSPKRFRTPRIPSLLSPVYPFSKALTERDFLFDQSFFIAEIRPYPGALQRKPLLLACSFLIGVFQGKRFLPGFAFPPFSICFPASVV